MNKTVNVIIPIYNTEQYLDKCIESVLNQTYKELKLFLIDDGSTDSSAKKCDDYSKSDDRIIVVHKKNEGQGIARNVALDMIDGDGYIAFVDSDDYIENNMLEVMISEMERNNVNLSICGTTIKNRNNEKHVLAYNEVKLFNDEEMMREFVTSNRFLGVVWNKIFRTSVFSNIRFPSFRAHEDGYILHELLAKSGKAIYVPKCFYIQNTRIGSTENSDFSERNLALLEDSAKLMGFINDNYPELYKFVAAKRVNNLAVLMFKIRRGFTYHKYTEIYNKLENTLNNEYYSVHKEYPDSIIRLTKIAVEHKVKFKMYCFYCGIRKIIGGLFKKQNG